MRNTFKRLFSYSHPIFPAPLKKFPQTTHDAHLGMVSPNLLTMNMRGNAKRHNEMEYQKNIYDKMQTIFQILKENAGIHTIKLQESPIMPEHFKIVEAYMQQLPIWRNSVRDISSAGLTTISREHYIYDPSKGESSTVVQFKPDEFIHQNLYQHGMSEQCRVISSAENPGKKMANVYAPQGENANLFIEKMLSIFMRDMFHLSTQIKKPVKYVVSGDFNLNRDDVKKTIDSAWEKAGFFNHRNLSVECYGSRDGREVSATLKLSQ